jgi:hypothetical protein
VTDLTFEQAENAAMQRKAEQFGADYAIDSAARIALSDQLVFLRNNPAHIDDPIVYAGGGGTLTAVIGWGCDDEAAILLGRLAARGWRLVRG